MVTHEEVPLALACVGLAIMLASDLVRNERSQLAVCRAGFWVVVLGFATFVGLLVAGWVS